MLATVAIEFGNKTPFILKYLDNIVCKMILFAKESEIFYRNITGYKIDVMHFIIIHFFIFQVSHAKKSLIILLGVRIA